MTTRAATILLAVALVLAPIAPIRADFIAPAADAVVTPEEAALLAADPALSVPAGQGRASEEQSVGETIGWGLFAGAIYAGAIGLLIHIRRNAFMG